MTHTTRTTKRLEEPCHHCGNPYMVKTTHHTLYRGVAVTDVSILCPACHWGYGYGGIK